MIKNIPSGRVYLQKQTKVTANQQVFKSALAFSLFITRREIRVCYTSKKKVVEDQVVLLEHKNSLSTQNNLSIIIRLSLISRQH